VDYSNHRSCWITNTNPEVHRILERGFKDSPLYAGIIKSIGPRYCPSIEDKIVTFSEKENHLLFVEPEGLSTNEYYLNGFSSSLPLEIQLAAMRKIKGLEEVKIFRPGYAIEYDYFPPTQLNHTLETKKIKNLYLAGQINGTTGYEEAAAQGIIAGINAHLKINKGKEFILERDQAYIGVLIDDLVTKGVDEPYRMFTSRAEYRILLRQDDADERLTPVSYKIGLASLERKKLLEEKTKLRNKVIYVLSKTSIAPGDINKTLKLLKTSQLKQKIKSIDLIRRPEISIKDLIFKIKDLKDAIDGITDRKNEIIESAEINIKYAGYIKREKQIADKIKRLDKIRIDKKIDYTKIKSLSTEARQKLKKIRPVNIGQASRISGVSPADINVLLVYMGR
jgi:tRNA uridine 5-carboxymethylaminomethyl modification enzyme